MTGDPFEGLADAQPFAALAAAGFLADLVPIIPPGAQLSPKSDVDPTDRGKVPGKLKRDGSWIGFKNWTQHTATADDLQTWRAWPGAGVGIQTRRTPAIDIDVTVAGLADAIEAAAVTLLGPAPKRTGEAPKRLLPYRCATPFKKIRITLKRGAEKHAVEILGDGQQFVARGIHRGTGAPYSWHGGDLTTGYDRLIEITTDAVNDFAAEVRRIGAEAGYEVDGASTAAASDSGSRLPIGADSLKGDPEHIRSALAALGNGDDVDYDEWMTRVRAIKAALGGDEGPYPIYEQWCLLYLKNTPEIARAKWDSIHESTVGARYLYDAAQAAGWKGWVDVSGFEVVARPLPPGIRQLPVDFDPRKIPVRDFILGKRLLRGAVSEIVGAGGVLKSMVGLCSAVAIRTKREITGERVRVPGNVLIYDAEDPGDEFERRIAGICAEHKIAFADVRSGLFYWSGHDKPLFVASKERDRITTNETEVANLIEFILANKIVAVFLAPLIGLHKGAAENSNEDMEAIMAVLRRIAAEGNCAVSVAHHTTKSSAKDKDAGAGDINIGRGAGSTTAAVRSGHTLTWIDAKTVQELQLPSANIIRLTAGKGNYSPRGQESLWFEVKSVDVGNGTPTHGAGFVNPNDPPTEPSDTVGVPVIFDMAAAERAARGVALARQDSLAGVIAAAMSSDRCSVGTVTEAVMSHEKCQQSKARDRVRATIPETDIGVRAIVGGRVCTLRRKRKGDYPNAPVELIRAWEVN